MVRKAIQQHVVEYAESDKALKILGSSTASKPNSRRLDLCLAPMHNGVRTSEVDAAYLFLTIIKLHSGYFSHTQAHAYTTISSHMHPHTYKKPVAKAGGEAAGVGHTESCSCRPACRRISSIWSFSVRRSNKRDLAVG